MSINKITIVSLNGDNNTGGVERVVYYLKKILSEKYPVKIIKKSGKSCNTDKLVFPLLFSIKLLFRKNTLVISNSWQSFLFPVDFSIHHGTTAGYMFHAGVSSRKSAFLAWMEKVSARRAKTVLAVSRNCKQELEDLYGITSKKIIVLNNFVDERLFYPEAVSQSKKIRVLFSGRLEERKGLSKLVELAKAVELTENYELRIATNSQDNAEQCKGLKNTLININLDIQAMHDFYNAGDIFFFPTKYEGFSMATLEALASGIPVIGTGFAIPEELRHYDFVQIVESQRTEELLEKAAIMVDTFKNRRLEIHNTIIKDFGSGQYKVKLFSLLQI